MEEDVEHSRHTVPLIGKDGQVAGEAPVEVVVRDGIRRSCTVSLNWEGRSFEATTGDTYHAFQEVRIQLEALGLLVLCYGSCPDVQVSGMCIDMGDGTYAYRLSQRQDGRPVMVNIFDSEPGIEPSTVEQQRAYSKTRLA